MAQRMQTLSIPMGILSNCLFVQITDRIYELFDMKSHISGIWWTWCLIEWRYLINYRINHQLSIISAFLYVWLWKRWDYKGAVLFDRSNHFNVQSCSSSRCAISLLNRSWWWIVFLSCCAPDHTGCNGGGNWCPTCCVSLRSRSSWLCRIHFLLWQKDLISTACRLLCQSAESSASSVSISLSFSLYVCLSCYLSLSLILSVWICVPHCCRLFFTLLFCLFLFLFLF